jgi:RNA polymerase sigma factor (sigma-70 family)
MKAKYANVSIDKQYEYTMKFIETKDVKYRNEVVLAIMPFISKMAKKLHSVCVNSTVDYEDVVNNGVITAIEALNRMTYCTGSPLAYLGANIKKNMCLLCFGTGRKKTEGITVSIDDVVEQKDDNNNPLQTLLHSHELDEINEQFNNLSTNGKNIVRLAVLEGLSRTDIAKQTNTPYENVNYLLNTGLERNKVSL